MKKWKSIPVLLLIFVMLVSFTGCIIIPRYTYYNDIDKATIDSVEIYDLRKSNTTYSHFLETETPVYTVTEDQLDGFLSDLADIRFTDYIIVVIAAINPSFSYGEWLARINYLDGSYRLISCNGYGETFDANDRMMESNHFGCDTEEWNQFVGQYVPEEIFGNP